MNRKLSAPSFVGALLLFSLLGCKTLLHKNHSDELDQAVLQTTGASSLDTLCAKGQTGACALGGKPASASQPLPILQSVTSPTQSRFVIVVPDRDHPLYFLKRARANQISRLVPERFSRSTSKSAVDQLEAFDLKLDEDYELFVVGEDGDLWDRRSFRALRSSGGGPARIAVISCMDDHLKEPMLKMWPQVLSQKPDAIWMIGDNVYADHLEKGFGDTNPSILWDRYIETRKDLPVFQANPLIPVFATWDDHDYGRNNSDRTYAYKEQSTEIFFTFFAQKKPAPGFERGPGISSWWKTFGFEVGFLDDRSFRSPGKVDLPDETHLGEDQDQWINAHLASTKSPVLLVEGDQFFGGYHRFESYEGSHPNSFKKALGDWRASKVPLLFVSGDRHLSEIIKVAPERLGFATFEITSSGIHAPTYPNSFKDNPNPNQLVGVAGQYNYSILEFMRAERGLLQLSVQAFTLDKKLLYQKTLTVKR